MNIKPIKTEEQYQQALSRIEELISAEPDTLGFDELELLSALVELYEIHNYHIDSPEPVRHLQNIG